jgi:hypothetical protein
MDYLKELSVQLGGKIYVQNLLGVNFKGFSFRTLIIRNYRNFNIHIDEYETIFDIQIKVDSDFSFSINNPERVCLFNKQISAANFPYRIFISNLNNNPFADVNFQIFWNTFSLSTEKLGLSKDESIFVYGNQISIAVTPIRNFKSILEEFIDLIENNPSIFIKNTKENIFKKNIPENLRPLVPLLKKWCILDDNEREQLVEETSQKQKQKLVKTVWPYMVEINSFLDSFGDEPLSHEAILMGNLAELVSELQIESN